MLLQVLYCGKDINILVLLLSIFIKYLANFENGAMLSFQERLKKCGLLIILLLFYCGIRNLF